MDTIFNRKFWLDEWEKTKSSDTYAVHKGFATAEYWDKASVKYNKSSGEQLQRKTQKSLERFREAGLLYDGMTVLEIGCGTGELAAGMAENGARVTAMDFSKGMLDRFRAEMPPGLKKRITLIRADWHGIDLAKKGWEKAFDLVVAFMSPGVASPGAFSKMMAAAKKGCAVKGWASKRPDPVMAALWEKIMDRPLVDSPQSILYKINLLFSMNLFPDIWFDVMEWEKRTTLAEEIENQLVFFRKVSTRPETELRRMIRTHLTPMQEEGSDVISRLQQGLTATAVWTWDKWQDGCRL